MHFHCCYPFIKLFYFFYKGSLFKAKRATLCKFWVTSFVILSNACWENEKKRELIVCICQSCYVFACRGSWRMREAGEWCGCLEILNMLLVHRQPTISHFKVWLKLIRQTALKVRSVKVGNLLISLFKQFWNLSCKIRKQANYQVFFFADTTYEIKAYSDELREHSIVADMWQSQHQWQVAWWLKCVIV